MHASTTSDVVFPEKYFFGNFPENFWKFSKEKENIPHYLIYQKKSYEPQYHMSVHLCTTLVLYVRRQTFQTHLMSAD